MAKFEQLNLANSRKTLKGKTEPGGGWPSNYRGVVFLLADWAVAGWPTLFGRYGCTRQENGLTHLFRHRRLPRT